VSTEDAIEAIERDSRKHVALSLARFAEPQRNRRSRRPAARQSPRNSGGTNASLSANRRNLIQKGKLIGYRPGSQRSQVIAAADGNLTPLALVFLGARSGRGLWTNGISILNFITVPRIGSMRQLSPSTPEWSVGNGDQRSQAK